MKSFHVICSGENKQTNHAKIMERRGGKGEVKEYLKEENREVNIMAFTQKTSK